MCLPNLESLEKGQPLVGAFVPNSLPISSVFAIHFIWCQPLSLNPMESSLATQDVPNLKFPGDESSLLVGVPISKGVASPREASNQKLKGCFFHRKPLSSLEELCISSRGSSPNPEPSTPPVGRFSN